MCLRAVSEMNPKRNMLSSEHKFPNPSVCLPQLRWGHEMALTSNNLNLCPQLHANNHSLSLFFFFVLDPSSI